ncbi:DNA primase [Crenothrix polyspora]|uniref:DNA primase n=1 Tax=Crenothrix polyspora TaxID=360316 RepID=A0A1R4GZS4_9GAMM|nr:DNA primase [Crenothrix polyspora]SJM89465.1 DNA primase [Crenothrix polyspora]
MSGGRIPREFIDDLLTRIDIVDLIDSYVPLKKVGTNHSARCPFHTEKSPSFSVNRAKQFYHCFGCGVSGNAISFVMEFNHLDFVEAIEDLASFAGVDVPRESANNQQPTQAKDTISNLYLLMEQVTALYVQQLRASADGKIAVDYLKNRGITGDIAGQFMLGYAPNAWNTLTERFPVNTLVDAGLLVARDDGSAYDRFRHRIMFPIRDKRGRVIGFGGRVLDDSLPKYLNSPETTLFHKGKEVYGLYELLQSNPKPQRILIVEGYMDVIALAQAGINYAVATLGTAASQAHLDLLFRFSSELIFCFDGDKAGREAAWRAMEVAFTSMKDGRQLRIMLLPSQHDPDSLVRDEGLIKFTERTHNAQALSAYFFEQLSAKLNLTEMESRAQLVAKAKPYLEKLSDSAFKDMMLSHLKDLSGLTTLDIPEKISTFNAALDNSPQNKARNAGRLSSARTAIALLLQNPQIINLIEEKDIDWDELEFSGVELLKDIIKTITIYRPSNATVLMEYYRDNTQENTVKKLIMLDLMLSEDKIVDTFNDTLTRLLSHARSNTLEKLLNKGTALLAHEKETLRKLLAQK